MKVRALSHLLHRRLSIWDLSFYSLITGMEDREPDTPWLLRIRRADLEKVARILEVDLAETLGVLEREQFVKPLDGDEPIRLVETDTVRLVILVLEPSPGRPDDVRQWRGFRSAKHAQREWEEFQAAREMVRQKVASGAYLDESREASAAFP